MNNKTLAQIIQNNIRVKNLGEKAAAAILLYMTMKTAKFIEDIALEVGDL